MLAILVCVVACGRVGFDSVGDGGIGATGDGPPTMPAAACPVLPTVGASMQVSTVMALRDALTSVPDGSTVLVADGTYTLTSPLEIDRGITVRSASGDASTAIFNGNVDPLVRLNGTDTKLVSVTVAKGPGDLVVVEPRGGVSDITGVVIYDVTLENPELSAVRIRPFNSATSGPFADDGLVACSRFVDSSVGACSEPGGAIDVNADGASGWTVRNNVFDHTRCSVEGYRTIAFDAGSRDTQVLSNFLVGVSAGIALGDFVGRTYPDPLPAQCSGTPSHRGGLVCNNVVDGRAAVPAAGVPDFFEGVSSWRACDTWIVHNTILSPPGAETYSSIEYRYAGTYVHIANNVGVAAPLQRDSAVNDPAVDASNYIYASPAELGTDFHFIGTAPTGIPTAQCPTDAAGKLRSTTAPAVGAFEP